MIGIPHIGATGFHRSTPRNATVVQPGFERFFAAIRQHVQDDAKLGRRNDQFVIAMPFVGGNFIETELFDERIAPLI
jgi:hypothetical protein